MSSRETSPRIGYVLKMYPRFSETFVLTELLAMERLGADLSVFSLRTPVDGRFHEQLAELRAPVTYLPHRLKAAESWAVLRERHHELPRILTHLPELLDAGIDEAVAAVELAGVCRTRGLDHLHAHFGSVATTVARLAARLAGIGYSFTAHAKDIFHAEVDPDDLRAKLADAEFVVTVSEHNLAYLRTVFGEAAGSVVRLYNGIDLDRLPYVDPGTTTGARGDHVVAVGRLVEKKGFAHLLDALALLRAGGRDVRARIIGSGDVEQDLRDRTTALGLDDLVEFVGPLPQGAMLAELATAGVMAAPCVIGSDGNRDGLPTVLLESLATGTPCVSTPVTGIPEAVLDGRTGVLVPPADAAALAHAVVGLLDEPERGAAYAAAGRALVEERFDARRNAATLLDLVRDCVGAARGHDRSPSTVGAR